MIADARGADGHARASFLPQPAWGYPSTPRFFFVLVERSRLSVKTTPRRRSASAFATIHACTTGAPRMPFAVAGKPS